MRDTIDMASEAQLVCSINNPTTLWMEDHDLTPYLKAFEAFVRADAIADEREACAKVCEEYETNNDITATWLNIVADAIRARGNT